ncbi:MAG: substrate-binding domain-containing protein [Sphingomonadaceae bacterium]
MRVRTVVAGLVGALLVAAPADARDRIRIVGSSTVFPFTTAVAENFRRVYPNLKPPIVESTGTGGGIKLFCGGVGARHPDIVNASRRIKPSEIAACNRAGVNEIVEVKIGIDGLVLAQAKTGPDLRLTRQQVYEALAAEPYGRPQRARFWSDIDPSLPRIRIEVIGPPPTSGTRDAFNELYMRAGCDENPAMRELARTDSARHAVVCERVREDGPYVEGGENDNLIVQKIVANPNAVGAFGYSFFEENADKLRDVPINGVQATPETIADGRYPGARAIYIYVKGEHANSVPGLKEFLTEFTRETTFGPRGYLARRGLVALPREERADVRDRARGFVPLRPGEVS